MNTAGEFNMSWDVLKSMSRHRSKGGTNAYLRRYKYSTKDLKKDEKTMNKKEQQSEFFRLTAKGMSEYNKIGKLLTPTAKTRDRGTKRRHQD